MSKRLDDLRTNLNFAIWEFRGLIALLEHETMIMTAVNADREHNGQRMAYMECSDLFNDVNSKLKEIKELNRVWEEAREEKP